MEREQLFGNMMESLLDMSRYISLFDNTLYQYRDHKLYATEVQALNVIETRESTNMTQLARLTRRTKGAISQMVAKLEKKGLVQRVVSPTNKSEYLLVLTQDGVDACLQHRAAKQKIFQMYLQKMDDVTDEDFISTERLLNRIRRITVEKTEVPDNV